MFWRVLHFLLVVYYNNTTTTHCRMASIIIMVMHQTLLQSTIITGRVGMTNVTDIRRQWSTPGFLDILAPVRRRLQSNRLNSQLIMCIFFVFLRKVIDRRIDRRYLCTTQRIATWIRNTFHLEDDTATAASVRRSCQSRVLSGVPD